MALGIPFTPPKPRRFPRGAGMDEPTATTQSQSGAPQAGPSEAPPGALGGRAPIGVPEDYRPGPRRGGFLYKTGDEFVITKMPPEKIRQYQQMMERAGLLAPGGYRNGYADFETIDAFTEVLGFANANDYVSWEEALLHMIEGAEAGGLGAGGQERGPLVIPLSNPEDLKALHEDVSRTMLGRKPTEAETARFVQSYQAAEAGARQEAYGLEESGGSFVEPPSAEAAAMAQIRRERPEEAFAHDYADRFESFMDLLSGAGI